MSLKPRYWGTKKGEVLKSIVKSKWRTRKEILEGSGLKPPELDQVLSDLMATEIISEDKDTYDHSRTKYWMRARKK